MASKSATFTGATVSPKYSITLNTDEQSYSIANNTSVVAWSLTMQTANQSYVGFSNHRMQISVVVNGNTVYTYDASRDFNPSATAQYQETLASGTVTIVHEDDGTKSITSGATVDVAGGTQYSPRVATISGLSLTLTTIPRASTCSWTGDFEIDNPTTITIVPKDASFRHKITFALGGVSETRPTGGTYATTSLSWTPSAGTWESCFPTQTSRAGTLTLITYNGGVEVGRNSYAFTLKIPSSWKPTVAVSPSQVTSPVNSFIDGTGKYVAGYSRIKITMSGTRSHGAAIVSYAISGAFSKTIATSSLSPAAETSGVIATAGNKTVTVTITDARGRSSSTTTATLTFLSYSAPAITSLSYARGTYAGGVWTADSSGSDLKISFTAKCVLTSDGNNLATWAIGAPVGESGTNLASNSSVVRYANGIGTTTAYTVVVTVKDKVGVQTSRSISVPTVEIPFDINPILPAIGVGAVPQTARTLELAQGWRLNTGDGEVLPITTNVLTDAAAMGSPLTKVFRGAGASYTGTVPSGCAYGTFIVNKRANDSIQVLAIPYNSIYPVATNAYTSGAWQGWKTPLWDHYVDKVQAVTFSAGTIGTRAQAYSWNTAAIGGTPVFMQIINSSGLASFMPICTIASGTAYLNIFRAVSTALSTGSATVRIWYTP